MSDNINNMEKIKRIKQKKLREKKRRILRNRIIAIVVILLIIFGIGKLISVILTSNSGPKSEVTTLTLKSDGSLELEEVTTLSGEYDAKSFKSFAKSQIKDYEALDGEKVEYKYAGVKDGVAYVCTDYSSAKAYSDFSGYEAFYGTVREANAAGYSVETNVSIDKGTLTGDENVLILKEIIKVALPEDVLYATENWVEIVDGGVNILPINDNIDAPPVAYIVMGTKEVKESEGSN